MITIKPSAIKEEIVWTPALVKMLRGKRKQAEFGELIGAPKNSVWRWEAGYVKPDEAHARALSDLAEREHFLEDWHLVGSMEIIDDLEQGSKDIAESFKRSLARSARDLAR